MIKTFAAKTLIAAAALTALGLSAAVPANAHTSNMYAFLNGGFDIEDQSFATWSKTDGAVAPLAEVQGFGADVVGIEVSGEKGSAVGYTEVGPAVWEWNHATGATGVPMTLFVPGALIDGLSGLDTQLDGTLLTLVLYYVEQPDGPAIENYAVAKVNAGTGELTPVVSLNDILNEENDYQAISIATDPLGGGTFVFLQNPARESLFLPIDVAAGTHGDPTLFQGTGFDVDGQIYGADFDGDGTLYFVFYNYEAERYELSKTTSVSTWVTATRTVISESPSNSDEYGLSQRALTIEWTALANTGSELPIAAIVLVGTVAVLAGGVTVMVARRRAERGTV